MRITHAHAAAIVILLTPFAHASAPLIRGEDLVSRAPVQADLAQSDKSATAVVFLSARCPCSASHEETLKKLAQEFPEVRFVGVHSNADEPMEEARAHFAQAALPFPVLQDAGAKVASDLGALKTPHAFVFGKGGELVFQGGIDDSHLAQEAKKPYLKMALTALRAGVNPDPAIVRSLGCVIKR